MLQNSVVSACGPARSIIQSKTRFGAGTYIVNVDIAPGTYFAKCPETGYWARLRSFTGDLNSIITNAKASNPDGVYYGGVVTSGGGLLLKQLRQQGLTIPFTGPDGIVNGADLLQFRLRFLQSI